MCNSVAAFVRSNSRAVSLAYYYRSIPMVSHFYYCVMSMSSNVIKMEIGRDRSLRTHKTRAAVKLEQSPPQFSYRGINYTFVNCQRKLLEELKCTICLELVSDPVQTSCGHLFCGECIKGIKNLPS